MHDSIRQILVFMLPMAFLAGAGCPKLPPPVEVTANTFAPRVEEWIDVQAGVNHTCGVQKNGKVKCWGSNVGPDGQDVCQSRGPDGVFEELDIGLYSSCAIGTFSSCWGMEDDEELSFQPIHGCDVNEENVVECFGENDAGQATPPQARFTKVTVGARHSCGITVEEQLMCWGSDEFGQSSPYADPIHVFDCLQPGSPEQKSLWDGLPNTVDWGLVRIELRLLKRLGGLCEASTPDRQRFDAKVKELTELLTSEPAVIDYDSALARLHMELLALDVMELTRDRYYAAEYCCPDCYYMAAMGLDREIEHRERLIAEQLADQRLDLTNAQRRSLCKPVPISLLEKHAVTACDVRRLSSPVVTE